MSPRRNPWSGLFPVILGGKWGNEREGERNWASAKKIVSTKGGVFFTRFGHGGTLGEDNEPSFWMAT